MASVAGNLALVHILVLGTAVDRMVRGCWDVGEESVVDLGPVNSWKELGRGRGHLGHRGDNGGSIDPHLAELWVDPLHLGLPPLPSGLDRTVSQLGGNGTAHR